MDTTGLHRAQRTHWLGLLPHAFDAEAEQFEADVRSMLAAEDEEAGARLDWLEEELAARRGPVRVNEAGRRAAASRRVRGLNRTERITAGKRRSRSRAPAERECRECGRVFYPYRSDQVFCSTRCRVAAHRNGSGQDEGSYLPDAAASRYKDVL